MSVLLLPNSYGSPMAVKPGIVTHTHTHTHKHKVELFQKESPKVNIWTSERE